MLDIFNFLTQKKRGDFLGNLLYVLFLLNFVQLSIDIQKLFLCNGNSSHANH